MASTEFSCPRCGHPIRWYEVAGMKTVMDGCGHLAQVEERAGVVVFCFRRPNVGKL